MTYDHRGQYLVQTKLFGKWKSQGGPFHTMDEARVWAAEKVIGGNTPYRFVEPDGTALTLQEVAAKYGRLK